MQHQSSTQERDPAPRPPGWGRTSELDEQRLLQGVVARQVPAFDALYRCYHPRLSRFLDRMTHRPDLVEELLNDTMFVVWMRAATYNGQSKVSTWIFAVAYRKALKALQGQDDPVADDDVDRRESEGQGPEQLLGQRQLREGLLSAMAKLSPEHRAVIDLTYFHGADYREIAQIVDCPEATVKTRMFHARRRLRGLLTGALENWL
jgi:RNA polymerase sigma-70 factor (ECF subfamily)